MHFQAFSLFLLACTSIVSAYPRDVSVTDIASIERQEAFPRGGSKSLTEKEIKAQILEYLQAINTRDLTGRWGTSWSDIHGDGKSSTDGNWVVQVMRSGTKYEARVKAHKAQLPTVRADTAYGQTEIPGGKNKKGEIVEPTLGRAVHFLRTKFADKNSHVLS